MNHKIIQLLMLLCDGNNRSVEDLAERLGCQKRHVYRLLDCLIECGFVVDYNERHPMLIDSPAGFPDLRRLVYFTEEEARILEAHMRSIGHSGLEESVLRKVRSVLVRSKVPALVEVGSKETVVSVLAKGIEQGRRVRLISYASGSSNAVSDRRIEPVAFSANYRQVDAYDVDKGAMRTFMPSRAGDAELTEEECSHQSEWRVPERDCFWMTGEEREATLLLTQLGLDLLREEYPLSIEHAAERVEVDHYHYRMTLKVRSEKGVGRFVMGLPGQVKVEEGEWLKEYVRMEMNKANI